MTLSVMKETVAEKSRHRIKPMAAFYGLRFYSAENH